MHRDIAEDFAEAVPGGPAELDQRRLERGLAQDLADVAVARERPAIELGGRGHAEQQVLADRGVGEVALALERLGEPGVGIGGQPLAQLRTGRKDRLDQGRVPGGIDHRAQAEAEQIVGQLDLFDRRHHRLGAHRLEIGPEQQAQIVGDRTVDQSGRGADEGERAGPERPRQLGQILTVDQQPAAARHLQPGQRPREQMAAAAVGVEQRHVLASRDLERQLLDRDQAILLERQVLGHDRAGDLCALAEPLGGLGLGGERRAQPGQVELGDQLVVLDAGVLLALVEVEQLLPRRRQVFVCGEHADQRAERQVPAQHQVTADRQKEKRSQAGR